jgi:hypothetical protein
MNSRKRIAVVAASALIMALTQLGTMATNASAAPAGAAFTTFDATQGGCLDNQTGIDCNNYETKDDVYTGGGPTAGGLSNGDYYFTVVTPGEQNGGFINGADGNLSDAYSGATTGDAGSGDADACRTFTVTNHLISTYATGCDHGTGTSPNGHFIIQLSTYDDTDNAGGVYILAVCTVGATSPSDCKYDAFRVNENAAPPAAAPVVTKNANPSFDRTFTWDIKKEVDKTKVTTSNTTATFNYTVTVHHGAGVDSNWKVKGAITVFNGNLNDSVTLDSVSDAVDDPNATCTVDTTGGLTVAPGNTNFPYSCEYSDAPATADETNTATITWSDQVLPQDGFLGGGSDAYDLDFEFGSPTLIDDCVTVTDAFNGGTATSLGAKVCVGDSNPATFTYTRTVSVPRNGCTTYNNTATFTTNTSGTTGSASQSVQVCGPVTGGLTMGFWQNKNGQGIITSGASTSGVCNSGTWLRGFKPFQDLSATATCAQVGTYVTNVIKAANASGSSMNPMLKAQDLATSLDVYFSTVGLGGNKINAPTALGSVYVDLTKVCKMIDGSGGTATCSGTYANTGAAFGAPPTCQTIGSLLTYAANQSNVGGSAWYAQVKATQELAKNTFDAINNGVAFSCSP